MVLDVVRFHSMEFIYVCCDESNIGSYNSFEMIGAELVEICDVPKKYFGWSEGMESQRVYKFYLN